MFPSEGFLSKNEWNLSKNQPNLLTNQYSNNHRCGVLAWHPSFGVYSFGDVKAFSVKQWMILVSASKAWLWVQRDGGEWSFLTWTENHLSLHWHPEMSRGGSGRDTSYSPRKSWWLSPWIGRCRFEVDVLKSWSPPRRLILPFAIEWNKFSFFYGKYHLFLIASFGVVFRCVHWVQLFNVCNH